MARLCLENYHKYPRIPVRALHGRHAARHLVPSLPHRRGPQPQLLPCPRVSWLVLTMFACLWRPLLCLVINNRAKRCFEEFYFLYIRVEPSKDQQRHKYRVLLHGASCTTIKQWLKQLLFSLPGISRRALSKRSQHLYRLI
jgi:hypothetical protein